MPAYIINLDRDRRRLEKVWQSCLVAGFDCRRFPAIDGRKVSRVLDCSRYSHVLSAGATGCYLSHLYLWRRIARHKAPALIIEDDTELDPDAAGKIALAMKTLAKWDVLMLECSEDKYWPNAESFGDCIFEQKDRVNRHLVKMGNNRSRQPWAAANPDCSCIPGSRAYVCRPEAAAVLASLPSAPADVVLAFANTLYLDTYAFSPPIARMSSVHDGISRTAD